MKPLWQPDPDAVARSNLTAFMQHATARWGRPLGQYRDLDQWSVEQPEEFWQSVWEFGGVVGDPGAGTVLEDAHRMPGARWYPQATLNFAENLLRRRDDSPALVFWGERKVRRHLSHRELYDAVSRLASALRAQGVRRGDRVAAYLPNLPEAIVAMLAAASLGAIWSSCSPDFGVQGALDRFGQIEPVVLIGADGYIHGGTTHDALERLAEIARHLPTLRRVVVVPYVSDRPDCSRLPHGVSLADFIAGHAAGEIDFERLPFAHPLYILFSSGTTGVPKCIVHGAGGTLLQHLKEHLLHTDLKDGDRLFYFTTLGWMMWNWLVSGLAAGATLLLYDGSPFAGHGRILFDFAEAEQMTAFGASAKYFQAAAKLRLEPCRTHRLDALRTVLSTGSPLAPEDFDYIYSNIGRDVHLASISGGTDIVSCFVLGNPLWPVWRGEIQCRGLGMAVAVFNDEGRAVRGEKGELVCTASFPSMPLGFWNDTDGSKYHAAYFERFPGVWHHGDYAEQTGHDGFIIYGRSDAVLKPGGVRIGTAEIYRQVDQLDEVLESIVIGQDWNHDVRIVLFVRLRDELVLDDALVARIKAQIRDHTTAHHVPAKILQVGDIPRTKSGKLVELAVRHVVHGRPVRNVEALANPEALEHFRNRAELQSD